jgi:hypothetical protein
VQFTQRWVRDSLARCGFQVTVDTAPAEIVQVIKERFGEAIEEKLAKKAKTSLLVMRGDIQPTPRGKTQRGPGVNRGGRPSKAMLEERKRVAEAQAQMQQRRAAERERREREGLPPVDDDEQLDAEMDTQGNGQVQRNPGVVVGGDDFVFESGERMVGTERILGPVQQFLANPTGGAASVPAFHSHSIPTINLNPGRAALATGVRRPCETCHGTGVMGGNVGRSAEQTDELNVLKNQVALLAKQITLMQQKRARVP